MDVPDPEQETPRREARLRLEGAAAGRLRVSLDLQERGGHPAAGELELPAPGTLRRMADLSGGELGRRLLPGPVREALCAAAGGGALRLRLEVAVPELSGLPWEALDLPAGPGGEEMPALPLGLRRGLTLVRQVAEAVPAPGEPYPAAPLRILVAWADPGSAAYPPLRHRAAAREAGPRRVDVTELPHASREGLRRELAARPPHVLHFLGHGDVHPSGGVLLLQGERAGAVVYAEELAGWLRPAVTRLAVLCACRTAGPGAVGEVLAASLPAVVGMRAALADAAGIPLARAFYRALFGRSPVDDALAAARRGLAEQGENWSIPTLYLAGGSDGVLFRLLEAGPAGPPGRVSLPYPPNPQFVGREQCLEAVHAALQARGRPGAALVGLGGAGKSQAAVEYAHARMGSYPGGVFWVSGRDTVRLREDLAALGRFFHVPETLSPGERAACVRDELQRLPEPSLLVVDNVSEETDLRLLPVVGACRILLTTRHAYLAAPGFQVVSLRELDPEAALALLQSYRRAETPEERQAAAEIARELGGLPLPLSLVANHVRRMALSFAECRELLRTSGPRLLRHAYDAIGLSWEALSEPARRVLSAAACTAGRGSSPELLQAAAGLEDPADLAEAVADLADASLVSRDSDRRVSVHELVRAYARGRMPPPEVGRVAARSAALLTLRLGAANERMEWREVRPDLAHARAAAALCRETGGHAELGALLRELGLYACHHEDLPAAEDCFREALGLAEAPVERALLTRLLGEVRQGRGDVREALALVRRARRAARRVLPPEDPAHGDYANSVGYVLKMQGRLRRALPFYRRALELSERLLGPDHPQTGAVLNNLGAWYLQGGDLDAAVAHLARALEIIRRALHPRHPRVAVRLNLLGQVLRRQGACEDAVERHREALSIYEETYGRPSLDVGMSLYFLAAATEAAGRTGGARELYREALAVLEGVPGAPGEVVARLRRRLA